MWKNVLFTMWFLDFVTAFNQSYNCQTSHYLGRNWLPKPVLILPSLLQRNIFLISVQMNFSSRLHGYLIFIYFFEKNHSRCAYLNASSSMDVIWFFISLMDSTVTGPITSFSRTCKPASMISKCVTPGIGKSANNINGKQINKYFLDINGGF